MDINSCNKTKTSHSSRWKVVFMVEFSLKLETKKNTPTKKKQFARLHFKQKSDGKFKVKLKSSIHRSQLEKRTNEKHNDVPVFCNVRMHSIE